MPRTFGVDSMFLDSPSGVISDGSAGCICGWAVYLSGGDPVAADFDKGADVLGLTKAQMFRLFLEPRLAYDKTEYPDSWPIEFAKRYLDTTDASEKAAIVAERIDHFIATKGKQ